jgi:hypothetical protein
MELNGSPDGSTPTWRRVASRPLSSSASAYVTTFEIDCSGNRCSQSPTVHCVPSTAVPASPKMSSSPSAAGRAIETMSSSCASEW